MNKALYSSIALLLFISLSISMAGAYTFADFNEGTEGALNKEIGGQFGNVNGAVLQTSSTQSFEYIVVAYVILIVFFSIIFSLVKIVPMFENRAFFSLVVAVCVVGLISLSGVVDMATRTVLALTTNPDIDSWSSIALFVCLILFVAVAAIVNKVIVKVRKMAKKDEAMDSGFKLGSDVEMAKMYSSIFRK